MIKKYNKNRKYVFTINNYNKTDLKRFHKLAENLEKHNYICYGLEIAPTTKTKHIQGYIELRNNQVFDFLHRYFDFKKKKKLLKFHIEIAKGSQRQNLEYIKKEGDFYEFGEPKFQGKRTDMIDIKNAMEKNPKEYRKIIREKTFNPQQLNYAEKLKAHSFKPRDRNNPPKVFWLFGSSGAGKTKMVYDSFGSENICKVSLYNWLGTGYEQQECFLLDDFRPENLKFSEILSITDRYPYKLDLKNSSVELNSPFIIFTTPQNIYDTFFPTNESLKQLSRRMIEINVDQYPNINLKEISDEELAKIKTDSVSENTNPRYNTDITNPFK